MQDHKIQTEEETSETAPRDARPTDQHPDWHPFAVWKSQIRSEQVGTTGTYRALDATKIADA